MSSDLAITPGRRSRRLALWVTVVIASVLDVRLRDSHPCNYDWNPSIFLAVGSDLPVTEYVVDLLGPDIDMRGALGHDGQYFFAQANDPLLLEPELHAAVLDRPVVSQPACFVPAACWRFRRFPPGMVVWTMLALSVLTFGFGTYATALVAEGMGGSPLWGLAFCLNLGVISELLIGGTGHLGLALVLASVAALQRGLGRRLACGAHRRRSHARSAARCGSRHCGLALAAVALESWRRST
jgi:hypothetical protein